jgi:hypothetical protein
LSATTPTRDKFNYPTVSEPEVGGDSESDIYMPYTSSRLDLEVEQLSATTPTRDGYNYPTVSEGGGERNKGNANVYVGSANDQASDSHVSLTSGATGTSTIPEEIPPLINEMVSQF